MWVSLIIRVKLLIIVVVLIVMFSKIGIDLIGTIGVGVGLIAWLKSDKGGRRIGLTGEYGQLIIEYGIVATILAGLAVLIMNRKKVKKGMERVGLIGLAILSIFLIGAEDLLTVYLAMEAQSLAFYTLAGLLLGVLAVTMALFMELSISLYVCSLTSMIVGAITELNQSYIKRLLAYTAIAHVGYVLLALAVGSYTNIFSFLVFMIIYIITSISKSNLVIQPLASTVSTITKALLYFKLHPYYIHFLSSTFSNNILYLIELIGLSRFNQVLAVIFTVSLLLLAGIPHLSEFFDTWLVFSSAIHSQFYLLFIFDVLSSVIYFFYCLYPMKLMYFKDSPFFYSTVLINSLSPLGFLLLLAGNVLFLLLAVIPAYVFTLLTFINFISLSTIFSLL